MAKTNQGEPYTLGCRACGRVNAISSDTVSLILYNNRAPLAAQPSAGAQEAVVGLAANEVGAWIAKRDSEYEAALADLTQPPCIDSLDDFGRTIYSALEDCPAMSVDKQADFIARAFWPLIATPAQPDTGDVAALRAALTWIRDTSFLPNKSVSPWSTTEAENDMGQGIVAIQRLATDTLAALSKPNAPGAHEDGGA